MKVSYSCLPNINSIIRSHNKKVMQQSPDHPAKRACNCRKKAECPLEGNCLITGVVYKADVSTNNNNNTVSYIGNTGDTFKSRYANHKKSFKYEQYEKETELSKYIWKLKRQGTPHNIKWSIIANPPAATTADRCHLCEQEKLQIMTFKRNPLLNKRSEYLNTCRHYKTKTQPTVNGNLPSGRHTAAKR